MDSETLIRLWLKSVGYSHSNSEKTASGYRRHLARYCEFIGVSPEQIVKDYEEAEFNQVPERVIMRRHSQKTMLFIIELEKAGHSPASIRTITAAILSFYKYNDLSLGNVPMPKLQITYHNRDITREEVNKICSLSEPRERAYMAVMAQSGLRPVTISQLLIKDLEGILEQNTPIPCKITVRKEIEKGKLGDGHPTFIAEDAVKYLKAYLLTRTNLTLESYLFAGIRENGEKRLDEKYVSGRFRTIVRRLRVTGKMTFNIKKAGKPAELRLYNLRKFFRKYANQMGFEHVNYLMNHSLEGSDSNYTPKDAEFYRELYAEKAMPFLRIEAPSPTETVQIMAVMKDQHQKEVESVKAEYEAKAEVQFAQITKLQEQMQEVMSKIISPEALIESINKTLKENGTLHRTSIP